MLLWVIRGLQKSRLTTSQPTIPCQIVPLNLPLHITAHSITYTQSLYISIQREITLQSFSGLFCFFLVPFRRSARVWVFFYVSVCRKQERRFTFTFNETYFLEVKLEEIKQYSVGSKFWFCTRRTWSHTSLGRQTFFIGIYY